MQVRYFDECSWRDVSDGLIFHFVDAEGETLAEIGLKDGESKLWKFQVMLPDRYKVDGGSLAGLVYSQTNARKIAELILLSTIVTR